MRDPAAAFLDPVVADSLRITTIDKGTNVYIEIYRRLRRLIESGVLKSGDPLPSESALSSIMCVGRTSLRTALSILYEDGYIETVRGKGSCVTGASRKEKYRRTFPAEILLPPERIALVGELGVKQGAVDIVRGDEFLTEKLSPAPGHEIVQLQQLYTLNEKPAVLSGAMTRTFPSRSRANNSSRQRLYRSARVDMISKNAGYFRNTGRSRDIVFSGPLRYSRSRVSSTTTRSQPWSKARFQGMASAQPPSR